MARQEGGGSAVHRRSKRSGHERPMHEFRRAGPVHEEFRVEPCVSDASRLDRNAVILLAAVLLATQRIDDLELDARLERRQIIHIEAQGDQL